MAWQVIHLKAEATQDERWRKAHCECGLRHCDPCNTDFVTELCPTCKARGCGLVEHGQPLWPERWNCKELAKKKKNPDVWESSWQGMPTVAGGYWFGEAPPHYYEVVKPAQFNIYLLCDPSLRKGKRNDRTAIAAVGLGEDQNFYVLDLVLRRMDPRERTAHLFRIHRKYGRQRVLGVGYEEYGLQADIVHMQAEMERENYRFHITELGRSGEWHGLSTEARISTLVPQAQNGRWWLPNPASPGRDNLLADSVRELVEMEWNKYPAVSYDDGLDVLSRINDPAMEVRWPESNVQRYEEPVSRAGSWMGM